MTHAIYSGSFDPVTFGHLDIIDRAARSFDRLTVVVGNNLAKNYVFRLEERARFLRHSISDPRVTIATLENQLLADYAYEAGVSVIVKGIRSIQDYDYERMMQDINITQQRGVDTHILLSRKELNHVSSSAVKEICRYQGFTHEYVPLIVKEALEQRLNGQVIIGVTGEVATGKSYLGERLKEVGTAHGITVHNIDLDQIVHQILLERPEPAYTSLRDQVRTVFNLPQMERKALGDIVFNNPEQMTVLSEMIRVPLLTRLRNEMAGRKGVLLINSGLLAETDLLSLCNNNVILVAADDRIQMERMRERGLREDQVQRRIQSQFSVQEKLRRIEKVTSEARWGHCAVVECDEPLSDEKAWDILYGMLPSNGIP